MDLSIPERLTDACRDVPERLAWLARLPESLHGLERRWSLTLGVPFDGPEVSCAWVAPVTLATGGSAVLKLGMPHMEGQHEIDGLRFWRGDPIVRLIDADDDLGAMLIERCEPGTPLRALPELEQDVVVARLLRRLWRLPVAPHAFRPLSALTALWSSETLAQAERWPDAGLVRAGLYLLHDLPRNAPANVLLATDLHAGNILRAEREPWLAIDPKPFVGDPAYDATQHLLNCEARLRSQPEPTIRRFADMLEVSDDRVRQWMFARAATAAGGTGMDDWLMGLARALAP